MDKGWFGLIGVCTGGVVTYLVTLSKQIHDDRKERARRSIEKIEELHETLSGIFEAYDVANMWGIRHIAHLVEDVDQEGYDRKDKREESFQGAWFELKKVPLSRLRMLVGIYAPKLEPSLAEIERFHKGYARYLRDIYHIKMMTRQEKEEKIKEAMNRFMVVEKICRSMQAEIIAHLTNFSR